MSITRTETDDGSSSISNQREIYQATNDDRRNQFTRSPSIEKIIKFNSYICSQNFFILPSILTWLRTSQTILKSYVDRCVIPIKSTVYNSIAYKTTEAQLRMISFVLKNVSMTEPQSIISAAKIIAFEFVRKLNNLPKKFKRKLLGITVYFSFFFIFLQLLMCLWTLSGDSVPGGLIFMLVCLTMISYANYLCLRFIIIEDILKNEAKTCDKSAVVSKKYVRPRDILGKRTISNVKLF